MTWMGYEPGHVNYKTTKNTLKSNISRPRQSTSVVIV